MVKSATRDKANGDQGGGKRKKKRTAQTEEKREASAKGREQAGDGLSDTSRFWEQMGEDDLAESQREVFEEASAIAAEASAVAAEVSAVAAEASAVAADAEVAESSAVRRRGKRVNRVRPSTTAEAVTPQCETSQEHDAECAETQPDKSEDEAELDRSRGFPPSQKRKLCLSIARGVHTSERVERVR